MALSMMGGLLAATVLTMTFLPALYAVAFRVRSPLVTDSETAQPGRYPHGFAPALLKAGD
jgi:hypothetical protein